jgi:hypothetical protein
MLKEDRQARWAFHDSKGLGKVHLAQIAKQFGYGLDD